MKKSTISIPIELRDSKHLYLTIPEGRAADDRLEIFSPGALTWSDAGISVRPEHMENRGSVTAWPTRIDSEIRVRLRPSPELREAYEGGRTSASVEFYSLEERTTSSKIREIQKASLVGIALVESPSYDVNKVELRGGQIFMPELDV